MNMESIYEYGARAGDYQHVPEAIELEHLQKAIEIHTAVTGSRPDGWYLGRCSPNSHRLAAQSMVILFITPIPTQMNCLTGTTSSISRN